MVLPDRFPPDVRVEKELAALESTVDEVTLLCPADPDRPRREVIDGTQVVRVSRPDDSIGSVRRNLRVALTAYRPAWGEAITARVNDVDAIHVHDLLLAGTALRVGERHDVPVVLDLHENYPEAVRQWRRADPTWWRSVPEVLDRVAYPIARHKRLERHWTKRADHVITVAAEAKGHYVRDCVVPPTNVSVVRNTVDLDAFDRDEAPVGVGTADGDTRVNAEADVNANTDAEGGDEFVVGYVGSFGPHRGLDDTIEAFARLREAEAAPDARLLLVGSGNEAFGRRLRALAADRGVADDVAFTGWVEFSSVPRYMAAMDVCLVPHASTPHTDTTVPHKLFQYMAMGKPVVVTDVPPLQRIVEETASGVVTTAGDPNSLAAALRRLAAAPAERDRLGANGRRAVETEYNWTTDAATLRAVYDRLLDRG